MSSSELPELLTVAHRILVLHEGRVAGVLKGDRMTQRDVLHLAVRGAATACRLVANETESEHRAVDSRA